MRGARGTWWLVGLAGLRCQVGIFGYFFGDPEPGNYPLWFGLAVFLGFGAAACLLIFGGQRDRRAVYLGIALLLVGSAFSTRYILGLAADDGSVASTLIRLLGGLDTNGFLPVYLTLFSRDFPSRSISARRSKLITLAVRVMTALALVLLVVGLLDVLVTLGVLAANQLIDRLYAFGETGAYLVLGLFALVLALWNSRPSDVVERRRGRLFLAGLAIGFGPILTQVAMESYQPYHDWVEAQPWYPLLKVFVYSAFATIPLTTTYSVLVHRVLDIRLIARRALQYALARYSTLLAVAVPFFALLWLLYLNRDHTLAQLVSGPVVVLPAVALAVGLVAVRYRERLLEAIDRRFFRERLDARQLLTLLGEQLRNTPNRAALADLVTAGIDRALHLENVALLVEEQRAGRLIDPLGTVRPLDLPSELASLVAAGSRPLDCELDAPRSPLSEVPTEERHWVGDHGFLLLAPLVATDGSLLGLLALGEKRSGLPFLKEDRQLLSDIAASAALALELDSLRRRRPRPTVTNGDGEAVEAIDPLPTTAAAVECLDCQQLYLPGTERCSHCGLFLEPTPVPYVLPGKFRFESRLGEGGMGVVYSAVDLALGRRVAVKTLRRLSPEEGLRLRREARVAARVSHPNLALVYGVESWRGTPMLIFELLEGGTLAERLERGPLSPYETVELGGAMAGALDALHAAGILHRDIKPTNIGFSRDGTPKLMDFGIARNELDTRPEADGTSGSVAVDPLEPTLIWSHLEPEESSSRRLVGTVFYIPPEALDGAPAEPSFDLWSLNLVLFECLSGQRAFDGADMSAVIKAIRQIGVPDIRNYRPDCPSVLSDYFARNLNRQRDQRAASAAALRRQLEEVRFKLMA